MKLLRNIPERKGRCKYALIRLDKLGLSDTQIGNMTLTELLFCLSSTPRADGTKLEDLIEFGEPGSENEFFTVKLKDRNSPAALAAYSGRIHAKDPGMADDVFQLIERAGQNHLSCKDPD